MKGPECLFAMCLHIVFKTSIEILQKIINFLRRNLIMQEV